MEARRALIAAVAILAAGLSGAAFAGDDHEERCEDRCEEKLASCESEAEARYDDCAREPRKQELECACTMDVVPEDLPARCKKQCADVTKALAACDAKREKRREKCEDKRDRCTDKCSD